MYPTLIITQNFESDDIFSLIHPVMEGWEKKSGKKGANIRRFKPLIFSSEGGLPTFQIVEFILWSKKDMKDHIRIIGNMTGDII